MVGARIFMITVEAHVYAALFPLISCPKVGMRLIWGSQVSNPFILIKFPAKISSDTAKIMYDLTETHYVIIIGST